MFFFRDRAGSEIDFVLDRGGDLLAIEVKVGRTFDSSYFDSLAEFGRNLTILN
jgi:predicted AAA+ superfamily ATPase